MTAEEKAIEDRTLLLAAAKALDPPVPAVTAAIASLDYALSGKPIRPGNPYTLDRRVEILQTAYSQVIAS